VNKDNLPQIIAALKDEQQVHEPFAGIYELFEGHDEYGYKIKANKEGLVQLSIALLKAAQHEYCYNGPQIIPLDINDKLNPDVQGFLPEKIELTVNPYVPAIIEKPKSWPQRFFPAAGCLLALAFIIVSLVIGMITVLRWVF
jgi:hypothetical protein